MRYIVYFSESTEDTMLLTKQEFSLLKDKLNTNHFVDINRSFHNVSDILSIQLDS